MFCPRIASTQDTFARHTPQTNIHRSKESNPHLLPVSAAKDENSDDRRKGKGKGLRAENSGGSELNHLRQEIGRRNLNEPEAKQIHLSRRFGVARAVERLADDHAVSIK